MGVVKLNTTAIASIVEVNSVATAVITKIAGIEYSAVSGPSNPAVISVTIPNADIDGTLTNFPLCIILTDTNAPELFQEMVDGSLEGINAAYKLMVMDTDSTDIPVEVDYCSITDGLIVLHALVPSISSSVDTAVWIYYNNQMADNTTYIGAPGTTVGASVWDANFLVVYHLNETPVTATNAMINSTADDGTNDLYVQSSPTLVSAQPAQGIEFNGTDLLRKNVTLITDYPATLETAGLALTTASSAQSPSIGQGDHSSPNQMTHLTMYGDKMRLNHYPGTNYLLLSTTTFNDDDFVHCAAVMTSTTDRAIITNGGDKQTDTDSAAWPSGQDFFDIGGAYDSSPGYFDGITSEARLSDIARSDEWCKATYLGLAGSWLTIGDPIIYEDLTTYTEVDENADYTITSPKIDVDSCARAAESYVYFDFGVNYFGDFEIQFEFESTLAGGICQNGMIGVSNTVGALTAIFTADDGIFCDTYGNTNNVQIRIWDDSTAQTDTWDPSAGTSHALMYATMTRVGTTATLVLYSDSIRTTVVDTLVVTCEAGQKRYMYAACSRDWTGTGSWTGYCQNFNIVDPNKTQDLTTYTEVDSASEITVTTDKCDVVAMRRDSDSYVYKDFGAAFFGDFDIDFEVEVTAGDDEGICIVLALSNTIGTLQDMNVANDCLEVACYNNTGNLRYSIIDRNTDNSDVYYSGGDTSPLVYCTITRVSTTLTLVIYSDSARTTVADTLSLTCETGTKRYLYANASRDIGTVPADTITLYTQNIKIITAS